MILQVWADDQIITEVDVSNRMSMARHVDIPIPSPSVLINPKQASVTMWVWVIGVSSGCLVIDSFMALTLLS